MTNSICLHNSHVLRNTHRKFIVTIKTKQTQETNVSYPTVRSMIFFQSSGTPPDHHDLSKATENGLIVRPASCLCAHECIWSDPMDSCILSLFKCSLTWSSSTEVFLAPDFPTGIRNLWLLKADIISRDHNGEGFKSFVSRFPAPFSSGPMFSTVIFFLLLYLKKNKKGFYKTLSGLNPRWALTLQANPIPL